MIRRLIYSFILIFWTFISIRFVFSLSRGTYFMCRDYAGTSEEDKLKNLDGSFYSFMKFCRTKIPPYAKCLFLNSYNAYTKIVGQDKAAYFFRQHKEKAGYYLYPILVYSEPRENLNFSYAIIFNGNLLLPEFEVFAQYSPYCYVLKRSAAK